MGLLTAYCPNCFKVMEFFQAAPVNCKHCKHTVTDQTVLNASREAHKKFLDLQGDLYLVERDLHRMREKYEQRS